MSFFKKLKGGFNKFGRKVKDVQKFGKKISRNVKKGARGFERDTKRFSNALEKGAKKVDDFNLYVPLLNDAKSVVSGAMRNVGDAGKLAGKTGMIASDVVRGDFMGAQKRGNQSLVDAKNLGKDALSTVGKAGKVYSQGARLVGGDTSALFV